MSRQRRMHKTACALDKIGKEFKRRMDKAYSSGLGCVQKRDLKLTFAVEDICITAYPNAFFDFEFGTYESFKKEHPGIYLRAKTMKKFLRDFS